MFNRFDFIFFILPTINVLVLAFLLVTSSLLWSLLSLFTFSALEVLLETVYLSSSSEVVQAPTRNQ